MEHFPEGIAPLRHWYINQNEKSNKYKIFSSEVTYQSLNGASLPSMKCTIKTPVKCKTSTYVLTEICLSMK